MRIQRRKEERKERKVILFWFFLVSPRKQMIDSVERWTGTCDGGLGMDDEVPLGGISEAKKRTGWK